MEILSCKIRIAVLWVFMVVANLAHGLLIVCEPGGLERITDHWEEMGSGGLFLEALFSLVPLWLSFMAITVKDPYNRRVNFILGIVFTVINVFHFFECGIPLIGGPVPGPTAHHILLVGSTVVATALIVWYAWKWPKQEA